MKNILWGLLSLPLALQAQGENYWQQQVDYTMEINMDVDEHQFAGKQKLVYTNNSPDTLHKVFYHLYFNAFQPGSMMDVRSQNLPDPDKRVEDRISKLDEDEIGYHKVKSLTQDGKALKYQVQATLLKVELDHPIYPGEQSVFEMEFNSQVPVQIRRSGRDNEEGIDYTMTQWYPKMAEYDEHGWHPDPYVAREFYAPFGRFDVKIIIDAEQRLAATGRLLKEDQYWTVGEEISPGLTSWQYTEGDEDRRTWHFVADSVHDFAWAADEDYLHSYTKGPNGEALHFYYVEDNAEIWEKLPSYTRDFFRVMNQRFGVYPYRQFSTIQGGDGGMEYPMCTMLKGTGDIKGLVGVMTHEAAHNWYYGVLASNEFQYPWMDEGFTSYAEEEVLNIIRDSTQINPHKRAYRLHNYVAANNEMEPLSTPADYYSKNLHYGVNSYSRGEVFLAQLRYILGDEAFDEGMLNYFETWKFKHPDPWDFIRVMEETSGIQLDWYLNYWMNTTKLIDYGFKAIESENGQTKITLENLGTMPMPLRLVVTAKSGESHEYYIPLVSMMGAPANVDEQMPWPWTHPEYSFFIPLPFKQLSEMYIDPYGFMADVNRANNEYPRQEGQEGDEE